jgi:hypothetical protein
LDARPVFEVDDALEGDDAVEASDIVVILLLPLPPRKPSTVTADTIARATTIIPNAMPRALVSLCPSRSYLFFPQPPSSKH